jgi:hypothetical protein
MIVKIVSIKPVHEAASLYEPSRHLPNCTGGRASGQLVDI